MILTIKGRYNTTTKEIESVNGYKLGGLYVPDENKIVCPDDIFAEHKLEIKVSKKGNLVAILKK